LNNKNIKILSVYFLLSSFLFSIQKNFSLKKELNSNMINFKIDTLKVENSDKFIKFESTKGTTSDVGMPELPLFSTLLQLKNNIDYKIKYTIKSSYYIEDIIVLPYKNKSDKMLPYNQSFYQSDQVYPQKIVSISDPKAFRGLEVAEITVIPFIYSPSENKIEVIKEIEIIVLEEGFRNSIQISDVKPSRAFEKIKKSYILNYERNEEFQVPAILYVCGGTAIDHPYVQQLFDWRHEQGYKVYSVSTSEIGSSASEVKSYIQNAYHNWDIPPEFVGLIGDVSGSYGIGYFTENWSGYYGEGDQPYALLEGDDLYPEILIGRLSVSSSTNLSTVINKTISYEKGDNINEFELDWYESSALVGDPSSSGQSTIITNEYIENMMLVNNFENIQTNFGQGNYANWMQNKLNDGILYFNYRGYIGNSGFYNTHINNANNGYKTPFVTFITCGTGGYSGTSITEDFIRAGTAQNPKGAVAAIGTATSGTHTAFNNIVDMGIYEGVFAQSIETAGGVLAHGKLSLLNTYPSNPNNSVSIFSHWNNLMGDPALHLFTDTPQNLVVNHPENIQYGTNVINVLVTDSQNNPVDSAWVTLLKDNDEIFTSIWTNSQGLATFNIDYTISGEIIITITSQNFFPYQNNIVINQSPNQIMLDTDNIVIIEDGGSNTVGNGNNMINPGEIVQITLPIQNTGSIINMGVEGELFSTLDNVNVLQNISYYANILPNETSAGNNFLISIDNSAEYNIEPFLFLNLTNIYDDAWELIIPIELHAGKIDILSYNLDETILLEPGQEGNIYIEIVNSGDVTVENIVGDIIGLNNDIELFNNSIEFGTLVPGGTIISNSPYNIFVNENFISGSETDWTIDFYNYDGYNSSENINIIIGTISNNNPIGPTDYGYYIYDYQDFGFAQLPIYSWIEIDPSYGGSGINLNLSDNGNGVYSNSTVNVELPFTFTFYGIDYNEISVSSNGWISFGETNMGSFRNYPLPGPGGPSPMLAAFWDDLKTSQGGVFKYLTDSYIIIEWSNMKTYDQNSTETFQVILYNTNNDIDDEILIQYKEFNNTSIGNYSGFTPQHGAYCTIGIEDHFGNRGVSYTFNNEYHEAANELSNESAIFITTRSPSIMLMGDGNFDEEVNIFDIILIINHIVGIEILNPSSQFIMDLDESGGLNVLDVTMLINLVLEM